MTSSADSLVLKLFGLIFSMNKMQFPVSEPYSHAYFNLDFFFKYMKQLISPVKYESLEISTAHI